MCRRLEHGAFGLDRAAIVESLKDKLKGSDKALVGNKGYRKYLRTSEGKRFEIDAEKIASEALYDGKWVLQTDLDATPVPFSPKVRCCGGMLVATFESVARELTGRLVEWARVEGADCIATTCPLCQANLEVLQEGGNGEGTAKPPIPAVYFTQLVGMALGCSEREVGLHHNMIPLKFEFPRMAKPTTQHPPLSPLGKGGNRGVAEPAPTTEAASNV